MTEKWKVVVGYQDYEVSSLGRVRRLTTKRGVSAGNILQLQRDKGGYYRVRLVNKEGIRGSGEAVHRLVAKAFIPNPLKLPEVNHRNGNQKWNNSVGNLEWRSTLGNRQHAARNGLTRGSGVCFHKRLGRWYAHYTPTPHRRVYLGFYNTRKAAMAVRQSAMQCMKETQ